MPSPSLTELARMIVELKYGDLSDLSKLLRDMVEDGGDYDLESDNGFAELLHTWAESKIEATEAECLTS